MKTKLGMGLLAALTILPSAMLASAPAAAQYVVERHYGYGPGPGYYTPHAYGPRRVYDHRYGYGHRHAYRHGWRHYPPGYFTSSAVGFGSFACDRDPAYKMDPRCYTR